MSFKTSYRLFNIMFYYEIKVFLYIFCHSENNVCLHFQKSIVSKLLVMSSVVSIFSSVVNNIPL